MYRREMSRATATRTLLVGTTKAAIPLAGTRALRQAFVDTHEPLSPPYLSRTAGVLVRAVLRSPRGVVFRTLWAAEQVTTVRSAHIIPPLSGAVRPGPPTADGELRVLVVGRVSFDKGHDRLPDIARRLPEISFDVAGTPSVGRDDVLSPPLPVNITLHGAQDASTLNGLYRRADVLLHLGRLPETYGLVLVEAMAAGLRVLAPDVPAFREVVGGYPAATLYPAGYDEGHVVAQLASYARHVSLDREQRQARARAAPSDQELASSYERMFGWIR
jgi:glycosyltransferase involved in cell wall biosynthesis